MLFATYRHHAVFTDNPMLMLDAESCHRQHAVIEQVNADLKSGALAHLPSGSFAANSAWLVLAAIAFNRTLRRKRGDPQPPARSPRASTPAPPAPPSEHT